MANTLNQVKTQMEQQFAREGVAAEVTFISSTMFSVLCEDGAQFVKAKQILDAARQQYDSEDCDDEIGFCAYYRF